MTWSGRDLLLEAFLPRFHDRQLLLDSLTEYVRTAHVLDDRRARDWLERDLQRDQELAAIEQLSSVEALPRPSLYALGACYHCRGRGFVRLPDLDPGHPDFGKAKPCPACSATSRNPAEHCPKCADFSASTQQQQRNRCWKCGRFEDEDAAEACSNPGWHTIIPVAAAPPAEPRDYVAELAQRMRNTA